ncbi:hypothetical protein Ahy_A02g007955 [Arachis hypogaea]|uniref:Uncharacterized protein n=1 Tax=Arachis hypogaea TaxID=3818 RepID=A0A445EDH3_ARAHY|nr:hypothetical protein Ahy_A02g007955 [Arachis hypogaea]
MASEATSGFQFTRPYMFGLVCKAVRGSAYMDSGLLGSPLLGRDEKHTKEREHAFIFQEVHHTEYLLETIREAIRQLPSKHRASRKRIRCYRFSHLISCATKSAIATQFQHVYTHEKFREVQAQIRELTRILHRAFDKVMAEIEEYQERSKEKSLLTHDEATLRNVNDLQSPPRVKTRGRPKNRLGSNLEKRSQMP